MQQYDIRVTVHEAGIDSHTGKTILDDEFHLTTDEVTELEEAISIALENTTFYIGDEFEQKFPRGFGLTISHIRSHV